MSTAKDRTMKESIEPVNNYLLVLPKVGEEDVNEFGLVYQEDTSKNALRCGTVVAFSEGNEDLEGKAVYYPSDKFFTITRAGVQYHMVDSENIAAIS